MRTPPKPRTEKTERQQDQRRKYRERQDRQDVRRRAEVPEVLPVREDGGLYRP